MTDQRDLFYPASPGYRDTDTSKAAAEAMKPTAATLRARCLRILSYYQAGLTADAAAEILGISILAARPRFTELKLLGKIYDTGTRRRNASGKSAIVWKAKP